MTRTGEARERLSHEAYTTLDAGNPLGKLQEALELSEKLEPMERRLRQAQREGLIEADDLGGQIEEALKAGVIGKKEADELRDYHGKVSAILAVDDFASEELSRTPGPAHGQPVAGKSTKTAKKQAAPRKKVTRKKAKRKTAKKAT